MINFTSALYNILKEHLSTSKVFKGTSKDIQNDLLDYLLHNVLEAILKEISFSDSISVITDETTDVSSKCQIAIILRYVLKNGKPVESFWTFVNPSGHDAVALVDCIKMTLWPE